LRTWTNDVRAQVIIGFAIKTKEELAFPAIEKE